MWTWSIGPSVIGGLLLSAWCGPAIQPELAANPPPADLATRLLAATALIVTPLKYESTERQKRYHVATGVLVAQGTSKAVLTNYHVVAGYSSVHVFFPLRWPDGRLVTSREEYFRRIGDPRVDYAGWTARSRKNQDLALVTLQPTAALPPGMRALPLADAPPQPREPVYGMGHGFSKPLWTAHQGQVLRVHEGKYRARAGYDFQQIIGRLLETTNPTEEGDSGGALVNARGELVGLLTGAVIQGSNAGASIYIERSEIRQLLLEANLLPTR